MTHHKVVSIEENADGDHVITKEGQALPEAEWEPDQRYIIERSGGHNGIIKDPANAEWLAGEVRKATRLRQQRQEPAAPAKPTRRERRVSMVPGLGGFGLGGGYRSDTVSDMLISFSEDTSVTTFAGETISTETTTGDLDALNGETDHEWDLEVVGVEVSIPLSGSSDGAFHPTAELGVGRADARLVFRKVATPDVSNTFGASGLYWAAGIGAGWTPGGPGDSGWRAGAGYRFEATGEMSSMRQPALTAEDGRVTEDDRLRYRAHGVQGWVGYETKRVFVMGGVRGLFRRDGARR